MIVILVGLFVVGTAAAIVGRVCLEDRLLDTFTAAQAAFNRRRTWQGYGALAAALASFTGVAWLWWNLR